MSAFLGDGNFKYEALDNWERLPQGVRVLDTPGVAVNSKDEVYTIVRGAEDPVIVFDSAGHFITSFGGEVFSDRTHSISIGPDDMVYGVDDGTHTISKFTPSGELVMTIGIPNKPAKKWSGNPFNRPTDAAISRNTGDIFVTDGYGNSRVHKYSSDGALILSWGEPGIDAGQFIRPHNIVVDLEDNVYVADRECHRVQVFDSVGRFKTMWNNIHRPDGMTLGPDGNIYIGELNGMSGVDDAPGLGHRISVLNRKGVLLARLGDPEEGEVPGKFIAPHGIAVDSKGDIYVGEVCYTARGQHMNPPQKLRSLKKLRKVNKN